MKDTILNIFSVISGEFLLRVATFLVVVVIARSYGPTLLGMYAIALAYSSMAVTVADNGLMVSAVVEISRVPAEGSRVLSNVYASKTLLFLPMLVLLATIATWARLSNAAWLLGALLTLKAILQAYCQVNVGVLKSIDRMPLIALVQGFHFTVLMTGLAAVYHFRWSIFVLLVWMLGGQALEWCCSMFAISRFGVHLHGCPLAHCWTLMRRSTPMGLTYTLASMILRVDVIITSVLFSTAEVGRFASAHTLLVAIYLSSWLFSSVLLPDLVRLAGSWQVLQHYVQRWTVIVATATVPGCVLASWMVPRAFVAVYGPQFSTAGTLAAIMLLAIPFIVLNSLYLSRQIALATPRVYLSIYVATAIASVGLSFLLGHLLGLLGIAVAILVREIVMFSAFWLCSLRRVPRAPRVYPVTEGHVLE